MMVALFWMVYDRESPVQCVRVTHCDPARCCAPAHHHTVLNTAPCALLLRCYVHSYVMFEEPTQLKVWNLVIKVQDPVNASLYITFPINVQLVQLNSA